MDVEMEIPTLRTESCISLCGRLFPAEMLSCLFNLIMCHNLSCGNFEYSLLFIQDRKEEAEVCVCVSFTHMPTCV